MASYCLLQRLLIFGRGSIQIAIISDRQIRYRILYMSGHVACIRQKHAIIAVYNL